MATRTIKATRQDTAAVFDILEESLMLLENITREVRGNVKRARRMIANPRRPDAEMPERRSRRRRQARP